VKVSYGYRNSLFSPSSNSATYAMAGQCFVSTFMALVQKILWEKNPENIYALAKFFALNAAIENEH